MLFCNKKYCGYRTDTKGIKICPHCKTKLSKKKRYLSEIIYGLNKEANETI